MKNLINLNLKENEIKVILDSLKDEILELQNSIIQIQLLKNYSKEVKDIEKQIEVLRQIRVKLNLKLEDF